MDPKDLIAKARELSADATPGPWTFGGIAAPDTAGAYSWVYGPCVEPEHQSGPCLASNVLMKNVYFIVASRTLIPSLADALEAAIAELELRDRTDPPCSKGACESYRADLAKAERERDTARAQVETLAGALRGIAEDAVSSADRIIARAALKAAGVET